MRWGFALPRLDVVNAYRMPAEWEPHAATWLAWPQRRSDWPGKFSAIRWVYAEIVRLLSASELVAIVVQDAAHRAEASRCLTAAGADLTHVEFHECPTDRGWVRDSGPIFVHDNAGRKVALDFHFNAWAKYPDWHADDRLPEFVAAARSLPRVQPGLNGRRAVLEGGSIDTNGMGIVLTTEECLLSEVQQRNPGFDRADYETLFATYLGASRTVWLNQGVAGDDTHGHVDDLARFVNPTTVVVASETDSTDANYGPLCENAERLAGSGLTVVLLPMPQPVVFRGQRLPASYANFLIANAVVLVPTFNDPADRVALGTLAELFPGRRVVGVHSIDLVWGLGTIHCLTQQEPV